MASINTLITDVQQLLESKDEWFTPSLANEYGVAVSSRLQGHLGGRPEVRREKPEERLRLSKMGPSCPRALWHSIHTPELAEPLPPWAIFKYAFGHLIEGLAISLAKAAGHDVQGEQDEVVVDGVVGHRDCIIDGCIVDVKSCSTFSFKKFKDKTLAQSDSFGYLDQIDGYLAGSLEDPLVTVKDKGYLWAIDKQLGHMCLYEHHFRQDSIRERIKSHKAIVSLSEPPQCTCTTAPYGSGGNIALGTIAGYSAFKHCCFPRLRTFLYASGPVYLTKVIRKPEVTEIDRYGNVVYGV